MKLSIKGDKMKKIRLILFIASITLFAIINLYAEKGDFEKILNKGIEQFKGENYEEALTTFNNAFTLDPQSTTLNYFIGITYRNMEKYDSSIPYLKTSVTNTPKIKEALPELIDSYYKVGDYETALKWVSEAEANKLFPAKIYFLKGIILGKLKKFDQAIDSFEKAKSLDPTLKQSCDFQAASILILSNQKSEAINRLKSVIEVNPNSDLAIFSRDYVNVLQKRLKDERPWHFYSSLFGKYDSNVVLKPSSSIADVDISDKDDYGYTGIASLSYTAPFSFTSPYLLNLNYSLFLDDYASIHTHDVSSQTFSLTPGYSFKSATFTTPITYSYIWVDNKDYLEQLGLSPNLRFLISGNHYGEVGVGYTQKNYRVKNYAPESNRDSDYYYTYIAYTYLLKESKGALNIKFTLADDNTKGEYWDATNYILSTNFLYPLSEKLNIQMGIDLEKDDFDNSQPSIGEGAGSYKVREDNLFTPSIALTYNFSEYIDFIIQYQYTRSDSNIPVFDYNRHVTMLGLEFRW